jgi:protein-S-isoprenylcysteine O-methyltransferase Ste14
MKRVWKFLYWIFSVALIVGVGFLIPFYLSKPLNIISKFFGIALFIYAIALASLAGRTLKLYAHKENEIKRFWPNKFTDIGIYKCMRHPMHLALAVLPLSIALIWGNITAIITSGWSVSLALLFILFIEEPETIKKFKNYCDYMQRVPAFSLNIKCIQEAFKVLKIDK